MAAASSAWSAIRRFSVKNGKRKPQAHGADGRLALASNAEETADQTARVPELQTVLLLHQPRQPYTVTPDYPVPELRGDDEVLIKVHTIGLNPLDWKAPDFNFAIPELPYISGREFSGYIAKVQGTASRWREGDKASSHPTPTVIAISTDYRDRRKAAYQEYAVALDFNVVKIPSGISTEQGATIGVAYVAAVLALGVSLGVDFSSVAGGPNLFQLVRAEGSRNLPEDVRSECLDGVQSHERAVAGDWVAVWGGSSTSANLLVQLAKLAGLRVAVVVDKAKHGLRLSQHPVLRPDLLIDSHDPDRAVEILRRNTAGRLRFGIDTRDKASAASLLQALTPGHKSDVDGGGGTKYSSSSSVEPLSPPHTPGDSALLSAHLVGLAGLPKQDPPEGTLFHMVPIKLFHEVRTIGFALTKWLERLLEQGLVVPPEIIDVESGLDNVNTGLDRMRRGEISGGKLVVNVNKVVT
ncbi:hypothetical protein MCOR27_007660 [Pyricularia oryzae]|uniref:Alcohol dehydrogenase-like N-terminal domain-containing protein n=2 Tax=Pyricularia TaxID=48558 RepID=A0ABQ8NR76_PYRGI|nr:hypothetical protein MCOR01_002580 [Pyricularia oryzae]KAI6300948.1 hypothetical protein MCOR33_003430 [Pyricularia grisea]KAH9428809.1 hypothetical protein MCOR02_010232 [Pyricularia oryzae]KAI6255516.1 hypothetical protein MCOR19_008020 [Pyricularia oryzae]KAI6273910.1 hypothetical protein MCOR27_007660 [Pyricularia oryzae]